MIAARALTVISLALLIGAALTTVGVVAAQPTSRVGRSIEAHPALFHPLTSSSVTSTNWAGYVVSTSNDQVTDVKATWTMPSYHGSCSGTYNESLAAFWVGIDGYYGSTTVEQTGTMMECISLLGYSTITYYAWYEFYPGGLVMFSMKIHPGDSITGEVHYTSATSIFTVSLIDNTRGTSVYYSQGNVTANRSSAEWIAEAPYSSISGILPLADFGKVTFSNSWATISNQTHPIGSFSYTAITMWSTSGTYVKAVPGALTHKGKKFVITWKSWGP